MFVVTKLLSSSPHASLVLSSSSSSLPNHRRDTVILSRLTARGCDSCVPLNPVMDGPQLLLATEKAKAY